MDHTAGLVGRRLIDEELLRSQCEFRSGVVGASVDGYGQSRGGWSSEGSGQCSRAGLVRQEWSYYGRTVCVAGELESEIGVAVSQR